MSQAPIDPAVVAQASEWLMLHWGGELDPAQRVAFSAWHAAHPEHQRAWQRLGQLQHTLASVPAASARSVLREQPDQRRRDALKLLGLLLVAGTGGYAVQASKPWQAQFADLRTGTGESRTLTLEDGTVLSLNSSTAVDVHFNAHERRIRLLAGEVLLDSGHNAAYLARPLIVETPAGDIQALGTRFNVREINDGTRVDLYTGALEIRPRHALATRMEAGQRLWFNASGSLPAGAVPANASSWSQGRLIAERQPLGEFIDELSRYRPGLLRCDQGARQLLLTGVFPLHDTDAILQALARSLPVQVSYRTRYWVTVKRRG